MNSVRPTKKIIVETSNNSRAWKILYLLILFFIVAYVIYFGLLLQANANVNNLIVSSILFAGGLFVLMVVQLSLISIEQEKKQSTLERYRALHDPLTDLPNRALLHECIKKNIQIANRNQSQVAILLADLDQFKSINDTLGHRYGDLLLQLIAPRLVGTVRSIDTVARLGGDEFAIVLANTGVEEAVLVSEKIINAMEKPFTVEGHDLNIGISIGIAIYPKHAVDSETLLQRADVAMYIAKKNAPECVVYNAEEDEHTIDKLTFNSELREAIEKDQLHLHYQPKIKVSDRSVYGVEALLRWRHPKHGVLMPDQFIPQAERFGLIKPLTQLVLEMALAQNQDWRERGIHLPLSVNISIRNIQDKQFPAQLSDLLQKWQMPAHRLTLEITESSMMSDPKNAKEVISALSDIGVNLAIDDYGTGYSSLAYIRQLTAMEIKIDKSFVMGMLDNEDDAIIVRSTIDLAHNMGRTVVAEGVVNSETFDLLEILRCDAAQGYYFSAALSVDELEHWLWGGATQIENQIPGLT